MHKGAAPVPLCPGAWGKVLKVELGPSIGPCGSEIFIKLQHTL